MWALWCNCLATGCTDVWTSALIRTAGIPPSHLLPLLLLESLIAAHLHSMPDSSYFPANRTKSNVKHRVIVKECNLLHYENVSIKYLSFCAPFLRTRGSLISRMCLCPLFSVKCVDREQVSSLTWCCLMSFTFTKNSWSLFWRMLNFKKYFLFFIYFHL